MSDPIDSFDKASAFALSLEGTVATTSYGAPAVMVEANGRAFVYPGRESHISFALALDHDTIAILMETEPETYFKTPHYEGWPAVLIRYDSPNPDRVCAKIEQARDQAAAKKPVRKRKG